MHAVVFLWQPVGVAPQTLPEFDFAVAADSGVETAQRWSVVCDVVIGDFDSAAPAALTRAQSDGSQLQRVSTEKDETDAELAIDVALDRGATELTIIGSSQGRTDHALTVLHGLGHARLADISVTAWIDATHVHVTRSPGVALRRSQGATVSLVPLFGDVSGVSTEGLQYALDSATLEVGSAFSVSNEFDQHAIAARIGVEDGILLVMQTDAP